MGDTEFINKVAADILRNNAAKTFTTKCLACGKTLIRQLRWLKAKRFTCPTCGGNLDQDVLHQLALAALNKLQRSTKQTKTKVGGKAQRGSARETRVSNTKGHAAGYQLVLQFRGDSLSDLDAAIVLEEELAAELAGLGDVDGHDIGSNEVNIFIHTSEPEATFDHARRMLERSKQLGTVTAAYRKMNADSYTVIWPKGLRKKFTVS